MQVPIYNTQYPPYVYNGQLPVVPNNDYFGSQGMYVSVNGVNSFNGLNVNNMNSNYNNDNNVPNDVLRRTPSEVVDYEPPPNLEGDIGDEGYSYQPNNISNNNLVLKLNQNPSVNQVYQSNISAPNMIVNIELPQLHQVYNQPLNNQNNNFMEPIPFNIQHSGPPSGEVQRSYAQNVEDNVA